MNVLFEPYEFAGITMRNRFVRSATLNNLADEECRFTPELCKLYTDLARGGVGLILAGVFRPRREWAQGYSFRQPALDVPGVAEQLGALVAEVHDLGATYVPQISAPFTINGKHVSGPSNDLEREPVPLDEQDIADMKAGYREAARVLKATGCDGVQIHCCHNDILCHFTSPFFNKRTDRYGGSAQNRARLVLELVRECKEGAGQDFPVMIKMNAADFLEGGMTVAQGAEMAALFAAGGICSIEPSCGVAGSSYYYSGPLDRSQWREGYLIEEAARIKQAVAVPVMVVGGLRDLGMMEEIVTGGKGDLISMCRPFIREPDLVNRWLSGDTSPAHCTSCSGCSSSKKRGPTVRCVQVTNRDGSPRQPEQ